MEAPRVLQSTQTTGSASTARRTSLFLLSVVVSGGCKAWQPPVQPTAPPVRYARAEEAMQRGDFAMAIPAYEAYLDNTSEPAYRPRAYYQIARAQYGLGEYDEALATLSRMQREFPDQRWPQTAALRGNAEYAQGSRTAAFLSWETAWNRGNEADQAALRERMERTVSEMTPSELRELDELVTDPGARAMLEARQPSPAGLPPIVAAPLPAAGEPPTSQRKQTAKTVRGTKPETAEVPEKYVTVPPAAPADVEPFQRMESVPLRLGALLPLSGVGRTIGQQSLKGMRLALTDAPDTLVVRDTGSDPRLAAHLFSALANNPTVLAVIAPIGSAEAAVVAPLANELRMPLLLLSHDTGAGGRFVIPVTAVPMQPHIRLLVGYAVDTLHATRIGALYADNGYGRALVKLLRSEAQRQGATIVGVKTYAPEESDFAAEVAAVRQWTKHDGLQALLLLDPTETVIALGTALRTELPDLPLLGTEGWNHPTRLAEIGARTEGVVFADASDGGDPRLRESAGEAPTAAEEQAFDTAMLARQVIQSGVTTREEALAELLRRGSPGDARAPRASAAIHLLRVHNGKVEPVAATPGGG